MNIPKSPLIRHSKEYLIRGLFLFIYESTLKSQSPFQFKT